MTNKMNVFDNIILYATPGLENHLITKAYADSVLGTNKTLTIVTNPALSFTKSGQVFYLQLTSDSTITLSTSNYTFGTNEIVEFTLIVFTSGVTATFPNWSWHNGIEPDLSTAGWHIVHCTSLDSGLSWLAKLEGSYSFPAKYKWVTTLSDATDHTGTSLRDAVEAASAGDMILFAPGLEGTITLVQGQIDITKSITIDGKNKITVSGNNANRIFYVSFSSGTLVISNLTMSNGYVDGSGAGIQDALGTLRLENCTMTNCSCTGNGGAISTNRTLTLTNCTFNGNNADGNGGAISHNNTTTANGCSFTNNTGGNRGGAICSGASLTLSDCTFTGNAVTTNSAICGGAIYNVTLTATDCVFMGNLATAKTNGKGGALGVLGGSGNWNITRCSFINNSAQSRGGAVNKEGAGTNTFTDCVFRGNTVTNGNGGACNMGSNSLHPEVTYDGCSFENNSSTSASGNSGVGNLWQCTSIDIHDCVFRNNMSANTAPVLRITGFADSESYTIKRCLFTGNEGHSATGNDGLVYHNTNATVEYADCVFTGNAWVSGTSGYKGCICTISSSGNNATVRNCTFTNNSLMIGFFNGTNSTMDIYNSVEYGNGSVSINVTANKLNADHYLSDKTNYRTIAYNSSLPLFESDGYTPATGSQVIDAGDNTLVTSTTDFNGEDRIQGDTVDLGAVEFLLPAIQGLSFSNNSPQSSPIIYQENTSYPVDELVGVEGVEQGDTVNYDVENFLYGGNDVPVIDTPGTYIVTVTVSRLGYRKSRSVNTVAIKKNTGTIRIVEDTIYAGDIGLVTASVSSDANGYLTCELDGETYTGTISNGTGAIELENIPAGTYPVTMVAHCTNYTDITTTGTISVIKWPGSLYITASDVDMGENITLSGIVPEDFDGIVSCTFEGTTYTASPSGGSFTMYIPTTTSGEYTLVVYATGSDKYNDTSSTTTVVVSGGGGFVIPDEGGNGGDGGDIIIDLP